MNTLRFESDLLSKGTIDIRICIKKYTFSENNQYIVLIIDDKARYAIIELIILEN